MWTIRRAHAARLQALMVLSVLTFALVGCSGSDQQPAERLVVQRPAGAIGADALTRQLDDAWAREDWTRVLVSLDQLERVAPTSLDFREKRYAAYIAAGQEFASRREFDKAADEFALAQRVDPRRGEANVAMLTLTETLWARMAPPPEPDYSYLGSEKTSLPNRPRYRANIVIPQGADREAQTVDLVDAVERVLAEHRDAKAVVVYGYSSLEATAGSFDVARAFASVDRLGWAGNALVGFGSPDRRDEGRVYLTFKTGPASSEEVEATR